MPIIDRNSLSIIVDVNYNSQIFKPVLNPIQDGFSDLGSDTTRRSCSFSMSNGNCSLLSKRFAES